MTIQSKWFVEVSTFQKPKRALRGRRLLSRNRGGTAPDRGVW